MEADGLWIHVKIVTSSAGTVLENPNGTVRSLNPAHNTPPYGPYHWEERPANTHGGYELCEPGDGTVAYAPLGEILMFGFKNTVPNAPGFSAMTVEPLKL